MARSHAIAAIALFAMSISVPAHAQVAAPAPTAEDPALTQAKDTNARLGRMEKLLGELIAVIQKDDMTQLRQPRIVPGLNVPGCNHLYGCPRIAEMCKTMGYSGNNVALMLNAATPAAASHGVCYP